MATLDFPSNPTHGQPFERWVWDDVSKTWRLQAGGGGAGAGASEGGQLQVNSATPDVTVSTLRFVPFNGDSIWINGTYHTIPGNGVVASNAGLTASTVYYVYLWNDAGTLRIEFSTTGHQQSATGGFSRHQKIGDPSRRLIGMAMPDHEMLFRDTLEHRLVRSWLNSQPKAFLSGPANYTSPVAPLSAADLHERVWVSCITFGEHIYVNGEAQYNSTAGGMCTLQPRLDGVGLHGTGQTLTAGQWAAVSTGQTLFVSASTAMRQIGVATQMAGTTEIYSRISGMLLGNINR